MKTQTAVIEGRQVVIINRAALLRERRKFGGLAIKSRPSAGDRGLAVLNEMEAQKHKAVFNFIEMLLSRKHD